MQTFVFLVAALFFVNSRNPGSGEVEAPHAALAMYLETAALTWMKLPECSVARAACAQFERQEHESPAAVADRIRDVAGAVARGVREGYGGQAVTSYPLDEQEAGLLLMSLAFHESRFRGYVADGRCSDPAWRTGHEAVQLAPLGTCDGGRASTVWQVHFGQGIRVGAVRVTREMAIADHRAGAAAALTMAANSIAATGTLRNYTGEWSGPAPAAAARMATAITYYQAHPFAGIVGP